MILHWLSHPHGHECHVLKAKAPLGLGLTRAVYRPLALSPLGLPTGGLSLAKELYDKINLLSVKIDVGVLNAEKGQKFHNRKKFIAMTSIFFIWIIRAKSFKSYKLPYPYEEGTGMRPNLLPTRDKIPLPRGEFLPIVYSQWSITCYSVTRTIAVDAENRKNDGYFLCFGRARRHFENPIASYAVLRFFL